MPHEEERGEFLAVEREEPEISVRSSVRKLPRRQGWWNESNALRTRDHLPSHLC